MILRLEKLIKYLLFVALFFPLFYTSFTLFPSYYGKTAIFQILVEIAFILYLVLMLRGHIKKPRLTAIFYLLLTFMIIRLVAGFVGLNPEKSFWGTMARMDGNFTWLHFFVYFYLLTQFFNGLKEWKQFLKIGALAGFLTAITGVMHRFGISPFGWWSYEEEGRVFGIIGNSIPFASYILFNIFIGFFLLADSFKDFWKVFLTNKKDLMFIKKEGIVLSEVHIKHLFWVLVWVLVLAVEIVVLMWSGTRGVIIAFLASVPLGVLFFGLTSHNKIIRSVFLLIILVFVALGAIFGFSYVGADKLFASHGTVQKILQTLGADENLNTLNTRLMNWRSAYSGWTENTKSLVIGYGSENYDRIFDKFYKADFLKFSFYETVGDKPHNLVLELFITTGILGFLAYLALFFIIGFSVIKIKDKKTISRVEAIILLLAFSSYFLQKVCENLHLYLVIF